MIIAMLFTMRAYNYEILRI